MADQSKMANINISTILLKRGNTTAANTYVGPLGELLIDTGEKTIRLQDGATPGGMSTLVNTQQLANVITTIEGITSNTANIESILSNISAANLSSIIGNVSSLQHQLSSNTSTITVGNVNTANIYAINNYVEIGSSVGIQLQYDPSGTFNPYNIENGSWFYLDSTGFNFYSNTTGNLAFFYIGNDGNLEFNDDTIQSTAYQGPAGQTSFATVANVTTANVALKAYVDNKIGLLANAPAILDTLGQIATAIQNDEANIGTLLTSMTATNANIAAANIAWQANAATQLSQINAANAAIITANTAVVAYINAQDTLLQSGITGANNAIVTANSAVVSYVNTQDALINAAWSANLTVANVAWTANAATQQGLITTLQSNTGGLYNSILGANASIQNLNANVGGFYTWANTNYGTSSYANANVTAYLAANPQTGTYSNTNVSAYLAGNITSGNVTSTYFIGNGSKLTNVTAQYLGASQVTGGYNSGTNTGYLTVGPNGSLQSSAYGLTLSTPNTYPTQNNINISPGTGGNVVLQGNIVAAGNVYYGNGLVATGNITAANFLYPNGVSILSGISAGSGTYSNTNVTAYLSGNISTGNVGVASGSWVDFRGTDQNWRMGYGINAYSKTTAITSLDVVVGQGSGGPDGFTVGQTGGASIFELVGYTRNAWFANNVTTVGNITAGNVLATGFFYANGTPFTSSNYGNTQVSAYLVANPPAGTYSNSNVASYLVANPQAGTYSNTNVAAYLTTQTFYSNSNVAAYLVANPQSGTYSNTNVSAYLTSATINTTGNITAGNLTTSGTYTVANITTTGAYGNITGANVISANSVTVSTGIFWANGTAWSSSGGGTTYSNTNVSAYLSTVTFYSNSNVAAYLVANPQSGTYSNTNVSAYLTTQTFYSNSNVAAYLVANPQGSTYSNANVVANLQNYVTSISTSANITTTANMIAPNYLFANGVNILSTITGGSGTYSNTNVAAYLTTQTFYSNSNVAAYLVANPQGGVYSNANVIANLQNLTTNVVTSANIQAAYFTGNGVGLTGITYNQIGNIYGSSSNVTLQAGSYSWTFDNTGNLTIPTTGNIVYADGAVFTSGSGGGGGT